MTAPEQDTERTDKEIRTEITARQRRENENMQVSLEKQQKWRDLIED